MNLSLKLKTVKGSTSVEGSIYLRLRYSDMNGKDLEVSIFTGVKVLPKYFRNGDIIPRTPDYLTKRKIIDTVVSDVNGIIADIITEGDIPFPKVVKERYEDKIKIKEMGSPKSITFWSGFKEFMESKKHKTTGYKKTLITLKNLLEEFEQHRKMKITFDYVVGSPIQFQNHLQDFLWGHKKHSNGYINKHLNNLSNFLYYCHSSNYIQKKPKFRQNDTIENLEKIYLYPSEVKKLFQSTKWDYEEGKDFSSNPHIYIIEESLLGKNKEKFGLVRKLTNWEMVKDIFLFQCSIGCRYSDIHYFTVNHFDFGGDKDGTFSWVQQKTDKRVRVPFNPISSEIYRKYSRGKSLSQNLFPPLSNQKFNKSLKLLLKDLKFNRLVNRAKKIGSKVVDNDEKFLWEMISSHSGRRTFIKNMIDLGNMDYFTIMSMTGHKTVKEFQKYVSVSPHDLKKGRELYHQLIVEGVDENEELLKLFSQLDSDKRSLVFQMIRSMIK